MQQQIRAAVLDFERRREQHEFYPWSNLNDAVLCHSTTDGKLPTLQIDPDDVEVQIALEHLVHARREIKGHQEDVDNAMITLMQFMGDHETAVGIVGNERIMLKWPMRKFKAKPERIVPAKEAVTLAPENHSHKGNRLMIALITKPAKGLRRNRQLSERQRLYPDAARFGRPVKHEPVDRRGACAKDHRKGKG